jgi:hypothetical protein
MQANRINYFEESEKYKPPLVKTLLIAEAPPPSGNSYFYVPRPMSVNRSIENDTSLPATIFFHYFQMRPETEEGYIYLLNQLKEMGIFLMDIVDEPLRIREGYSINERNLKILLYEIPNLRIKIKNRGIRISDDDIIFLLPRLHYKKALMNEFPNSKFMRWKDFRLSI